MNQPADNDDPACDGFALDDLIRIPGLFRRWELGQLLATGRRYHLEDAGRTRDGTALLAVYGSPRVRRNQVRLRP